MKPFTLQQCLEVTDKIAFKIRNITRQERIVHDDKGVNKAGKYNSYKCICT